MARYTYKVIPAPSKGRKAPGVKGAEARFAHGLEQAINEMATQGWEYIRSDILPSEERQGLTASATVYRSVLVFRREAGEDAPVVGPAVTTAEPEEDEAAEAPTFKRAIPPLTARRDRPEDVAEPAEDDQQADDMPQHTPEEDDQPEELETNMTEESGDDTPRA